MIYVHLNAYPTPKTKIYPTTSIHSRNELSKEQKERESEREAEIAYLSECRDWCVCVGNEAGDANSLGKEDAQESFHM